MATTTIAHEAAAAFNRLFDIRTPVYLIRDGRKIFTVTTSRAWVDGQGRAVVKVGALPGENIPVQYIQRR